MTWLTFSFAGPSASCAAAGRAAAPAARVSANRDRRIIGFSFIVSGGMASALCMADEHRASVAKYPYQIRFDNAMAARQPGRIERLRSGQAGALSAPAAIRSEEQPAELQSRMRL